VGGSVALAISLFAGFFAASSPAGASDSPVRSQTGAWVAAVRARALPARFDSLGALTAELSRDIRLAGPSAGAYVADLDSHRTLFAYKGDVARSPASTEKLYTTSTALARFGPAGVLQTSVLGLGAPDLHGVVHGDLYLSGGGDPTFGSQAFIQRYYGGVGASVTRLARALEAAGATKVEGSIVGDESLFDGRRGTPPSGYALYVDIGAPLTALSFDRGRSGLDGPAAFAASQLAATLRNDGVDVTGTSSAGTTPAGAVALASVSSPALSDIVALTNGPSDNFMAETLLKDLGARFGGAGTTAAGAATVRRWLVPFGIRPQVYDGSGLDRADHTSPHQQVTLLRALRKTAVGDALKASLPVAGRSGTLIHRMRGTVAAGRCEAKTGTLGYVSALAGYCTSSGGDEIGFAIEMNNIADVLLARTLQDRIAATLAACARPCSAPTG
jgi:D-alanyl-D-alanine carboxypeptidase/D-alanyl-D-alanine-endopeptidase (penicillin-binding protein 4)